MGKVVTNDFTITRDLKASLAMREGIPVGVTWKGFKAAMEVLGIRDDDRIASIEFGCKRGGSGRIVRDDAPDGIEVREV